MALPRLHEALAGPSPRGAVPVPREPEPVPASARRLGEVLVERGVLAPEQLAAALRRGEEVGEPLGAVLLTEGLLTRRELYAALAEVWGAPLEFVEPPAIDAGLARLFPAAQLARELWVPLRVEQGPQGPVVVVATAAQPCARVQELVEARTGVPRVRQVVTTDWDVQRALRTVWRDDLVHDSVHALAERSPEESASVVITRRQQAALLCCLLALGVATLLSWRTALVWLVCALDLAVAAAVSAKALISAVGTTQETAQRIGPAQVAALTDADLPHYTVLVPAYREAGVVGALMQNLGALDYPREKLEVLLLLEEDDAETLEAALAAAPADLVRIVVVPHAQPKTKPRACNVGLTFARGEHIVIFDAEDRPDPDQLKKAVIAFRQGGPEVVCVQAALNYFNAEENLLTRMFTLEYSSWFDHTLAGLDRLRLPIPLGGTSNHFRTEALRELGGWDPFNVTEDADLGIRASARGYRVAVIDSTTYEEANLAVGNWVRQRSRWIKGYLQTVLVHTRHPARLVRAVGARQAATFVLLIGGTPAANLALPLLYALTLLGLLAPAATEHALPHWLVELSRWNLVVGNGAVVYLLLLAGFKRRTYRLVPFALLAPLYWLLHAVAAYKALWQLVTKPFYWEKTVHGLTSHTTARPAAVATPTAAAR